MQFDFTRMTEDMLDYLNFLKEEGVHSLPCAPGNSKSWQARRASAPTPARAAAAPASRACAEAPLPPRAANAQPSSDALLAIAERVAACKRCALHKTRTHAVPGQGHPAPDILFIGEGPGEDEDLQGLAFVGAAGKLLTKMIEAMGYAREAVFIANIVKCRPPQNRKPEPEEVAQCLPFLREQISALKPKVIVAMGATAVESLLKITGITRVRGQWRSYENIPVMPTFHPSYLLRVPSAKRDVWNDLQAVLERLGRAVPTRTKK